MLHRGCVLHLMTIVYGERGGVILGYAASFKNQSKEGVCFSTVPKGKRCYTYSTGCVCMCVCVLTRHSLPEETDGNKPRPECRETTMGGRSSLLYPPVSTMMSSHASSFGAAAVQRRCVPRMEQL